MIIDYNSPLYAISLIQVNMKKIFFLGLLSFCKNH